MAVTTFIPELWAARLLAHLDKAHVATAFVNRDYEGEIKKMGDTVHINSVGSITVKDYTKGTDIDAPEALSTTDQTLVIDQAKYFNFAVDDVDKVQAAGPLMDSAMQRASYGIVDEVDKKIFATISAAAPAKNAVGTTAAPIYVTKDNAYEQVVKLRTIMTKNNVPSDEWKLAVPPELIELLLLDDCFVKAGTAQSEERLQNGFRGKIAGFEIYESNNLPSGAKYLQALASAAFANAFAEQIIETEAYRPEKRFADAVKGLDVYGVKNIYPDAVAVLNFTTTAPAAG